MKYKVELFKNKKRFGNDIVSSSNDPIQAVTKSVMIRKKLKKTIPASFDAYIMNENGMVWLMFLTLNGNKMKVRRDMKDYVGKQAVTYVLESRNKNITEVI